MHTTQFNLHLNPFGKLVLQVNGEEHIGVVPVRAFPIQMPNDCIAMVSTDGREVAWIEHLSDVNETIRDLILSQLAGREFVPEVAQIVGVSSFSTPSTWTVNTDRGTTDFVLRVEEDIRRIGESLMIADNHGINYVIRDPKKLNKHGRKILDRFL